MACALVYRGCNSATGFGQPSIKFFLEDFLTASFEVMPSVVEAPMFAECNRRAHRDPRVGAQPMPFFAPSIFEDASPGVTCPRPSTGPASLRHGPRRRLRLPRRRADSAPGRPSDYRPCV